MENLPPPFQTVTGNTAPPQRIVYRPIIPLVLAMTGGIVTGFYFPGRLTAAACLIAALFAYMGYRLFKNKAFKYTPLLLFAGIGYMLVHPWITPCFPPEHAIHFCDGKTYFLQGTVKSEAIQKGYRSSLFLEMDSIGLHASNLPSTGRLRITATGDLPGLEIGDTIRLTGKLRRIRSFQNFDGFDYAQYMAFRKVFVSIYCRGSDLLIVQKTSRHFCGNPIASMRTHARNLIEKAVTGDSRDVLRALLVGDKNAVQPALKDAFARTGTSHLLAISGLHMGIVAGTSFFIGTRLLSFIPLLLSNGWVRKTAAVGCLTPVWCYGLMAGLSPSTQRAALMTTVFLLAIILDRELDVFNTVAIAAMFILVVDPPSLFSISFQLSFSAVLAICFGMAYIPRAVPTQTGMLRSIKRSGLMLAAVSLFATIGTLPLVCRYFNLFSLFSLPANLLMVPVIGFIVIPLGLFSLLTGFFCQPLAICCLRLAGILLDGSTQLLLYLSGFDFAAINMFTPSNLEIFLYFALVLSFGRLFQARFPARGEAANRIPPKTSNIKCSISGRGKKGLPWFDPAVIIALIFLIAAGDVLYWVHKRFWDAKLHVTWLDVGQGSAALLQLPGGYTILADGGGFPDNRVFDVGRQIIAPILYRKKIRSVDMVILSHPNSDHLNGLLHILKQFNVQTVWTNGDIADTAGYREFITIIQEKGINHPNDPLIPSQTTIGGVEVSILHPPSDSHTHNDINANSLVFRAGMGSVSFLFTGDITAESERQLIMSAGAWLQSTVLTVPHHGSVTSSTAAFIAAVDPATAIISAGFHNRYHMPHAAVLKRYHQHGCRVYRTDIQGAISAVTDGTAIRFQTAADP